MNQCFPPGLKRRGGGGDLDSFGLYIINFIEGILSLMCTPGKEGRCSRKEEGVLHPPSPLCGKHCEYQIFR